MRVKTAVLIRAARVLVEVGQHRLVERDHLAERHQLGELEAVGDHHHVVAGGLAGGELRVDLREEARVVLDDLVVGDLDAGLRGEVLQGLVIRVDVQRPVGERDGARRLLRLPELVGGGLGLRRALLLGGALHAAGGRGQGGGGQAAQLEGGAAAVACGHCVFPIA
jgi:hypothetical protein